MSEYIVKSGGGGINNNKVIPDIYNHGDIVGFNAELLNLNPELGLTTADIGNTLIKTKYQFSNGINISDTKITLNTSYTSNGNMVMYFPFFINTKGYKYLCVEAEVAVGKIDIYNVAEFGVIKSNLNSYYMPASSAYYRFTDSYIKQPYCYKFPRQVVSINIEEYDKVNLFAHNCECTLNIYSIYLSNQIWEFELDTLYLPDTIYEFGSLWSSTPDANVSVVSLSSPVTIDEFTANSAVKIYGAGLNNITYGWDFTINIPEEKICRLYIGLNTEGNTYDLASVELNGAQIDTYQTASAKLAGYKIELNLAAGDNTITVKYKKDTATSKGDDCVYIYGIETGNKVYR